VTLATRGPLLKDFDADVQQHLAQELAARGLRLRLNEQLLSVERSAAGLQVHTTGGTLETEAVIAATGRAPNVGALGLREAGVEARADGAILVDERGTTSVPSIHAVGDVTPGLHLTPVAIAQGRALADSLFTGHPHVFTPDLVPTAVFCQPQVAAVGLTEQQARDRGVRVDIYRTRFRPLKHTLSGRAERTMMKVVVDADSQRVLGCHLVGRDAAEIIQGFAVALQCGARKPDFDRTVGVHPSAAEELVTLRTRVTA
jgi:glutathione reductase (NADPH)